MSSLDLTKWIRAIPFVPFRMRMNSGRTWEVRHPEVLKIGMTSLHVFTYPVDNQDFYEKVEMISPSLIESVEPIEVPKGNQKPVVAEF